MSHINASRTIRFAAADRRPMLLRWLSAARLAYRSRQHLVALDADQLRDVGITAEAAKTEANRPVWDVPAHWTQ